MNNTYTGKILAGGDMVLVSGPLYKPGMNGRASEELERFPTRGILWAQDIGNPGVIPFLDRAAGVLTSAEILPVSVEAVVERRGIPVIGRLDLNQILELEPVEMECRTGTVNEIGYAYYCCK